MSDFETTILGGLPVSIGISWYPAEPDVGIFSAQVEIDAIYLMRKRKRDGKVTYRPLPDSMLIRASQLGDLDRIVDELRRF